MTAEVTISQRPGDDFVFPLVFQHEDGTPYDVSGWTFPDATWRQHRLGNDTDNPVVATATADAANSATGVIVYTTAGTITADWLDTYGELYVDLPRTAPSRKTWCVVRALIEGDTTRT